MFLYHSDDFCPAKIKFTLALSEFFVGFTTISCAMRNQGDKICDSDYDQYPNHDSSIEFIITMPHQKIVHPDADESHQEDTPNIQVSLHCLFDSRGKQTYSKVRSLLFIFVLKFLNLIRNLSR